MSRPTLLTKEMQKEICGYIENGNTFVTAYKLAGISESIFYLWKQLGEKDLLEGNETIYSEFLASIKKAEEKFKAWNIQQIMNAGKKPQYWHANAWLLERKYPDEFGKKEKQEHSGKIKIEKIPPEERKKEIERLIEKRME